MIQTISRDIPAADKIIILFYCITIFMNFPGWGEMFGLPDKYARYVDWCVNDIIQGIRIILFGFTFLAGIKIRRWNTGYTLLVILLCLNIITIMSDYLFVDAYDRIFMYPKLVIAIYLTLDILGILKSTIYPASLQISKSIFIFIKKIKNIFK